MIFMIKTTFLAAFCQRHTSYSLCERLWLLNAGVVPVLCTPAFNFY